jgi:glutamine synthetase
LKDKATVDE